MLIFDGACAFCTRCAKWVEHRVGGRHEVVPFQAIDDLGALGLTLADVQSAAYWVDGTRARRGHLAIARALRAIGGAWWPVGALMVVPPFRWLSAAGYRWVADNRHRMPGGEPGCADCGASEAGH